MTASSQMFVCRIATALLLGVVSACAESPSVLLLDGNWHIEESFADAIHLVSCSGVGSMTVTHQQDGELSAGPSTPGLAFSAVSGVSTDCTSLDGAFNYFGDGDFAQGVVTPGDVDRVVWSGTVNAAVCRYEGVATGDDGIGLEMSGTLTCRLEDPGVTFNFIGDWRAWSSSSAWCMNRLDQLGCLGNA